MSDFIDAYWSIFIAAITLIGIVWCVWLLSSQRKVTVEQNADGSVNVPKALQPFLGTSRFELV